MKKAALLILPLLLAGIGFGQMAREGMDPGCGRHRMMAKMADLDLSADQKAQLDVIRDNTARAIIPLRSQLELKELDMRAEMGKAQLDKGRILKIAKEIHDLQWKMEELKLEERIKVHGVLTPEQRERLHAPGGRGMGPDNRGRGECGDPNCEEGGCGGCKDK